MKKLLFSLSLLASLATFATESTIDASAQIFGVLPVTVPANTQSVIVSVPWVASGVEGDTESPISISNLVRTANLSDNDQVKVWNTSSKVWNVWKLSDGIWNPVETVTADSVEKGSGADVTTLSRGTALILTLATKPTTEWTFYLNGQYTSKNASNVTCLKASQETPKAYTLLAPPVTVEKTLNDFGWVNVSDKDYITLPTGFRVTRHNGKWGDYSFEKDSQGNRTWVSSTYKITPGMGFWYTCADTNATANVTVLWTDAQ